MDFVKFGIIGIENMGSAHTKKVNDLFNCRLTAVCHINPKPFGRITPECMETVEVNPGDDFSKSFIK